MSCVDYIHAYPWGTYYSCVCQCVITR